MRRFCCIGLRLLRQIAKLIYWGNFLDLNSIAWFICSLFEGKQLFVPQKGCWYQELSSVDTCLVIEGKDLKYSFWTAYIAGLADQLFSYSFPESNIQTILDNYQGNLMYDLSREKAKGYITAIPQILGISQNRLIVDWKIVPVVDGRND